MNYWVRKEIHWELCNQVNFEQTYPCYIHKPEPVPKNETQKISGILR